MKLGARHVKTEFTKLNLQNCQQLLNYCLALLTGAGHWLDTVLVNTMIGLRF